MGLVQNDYVRLDWDESLWMKPKKGTLFAAAARKMSTDKYDDLLVVYSEGDAFMIIDDDMESWDVGDIFSNIKTAMKSNIPLNEHFGDDFVCIAHDVSDCTADNEDVQNIMEIYGFTEDQVDEIRRYMEDISVYWRSVYVDM